MATEFEDPREWSGETAPWDPQELARRWAEIERQRSRAEGEGPPERNDRRDDGAPEVRREEEDPVDESVADREEHVDPQDFQPDEIPEAEPEIELPRLRAPGPRRGRRLVKKAQLPRASLNSRQRLLLLDTWKRSGLPASDFASLVGISKHTLYGWRKRFQEQGPAGLEDRPRGGARGSRLPEVTRRAILLMKEEHPEWGTQRISDMLFRGPALPASPSAVARVLHEAGYELEEVPTRKHRDHPRRFERARPNQLWQSDLFTFMLKRQNRRVYLVAFLDDHSRFVVGWGLHSTQAAALVLEVLRSAVTNHNPPEEILTDNGSQYVTWRGRSAFSKELERRGITHVVSSPRRPQTLGKVERFWGTLWREFLEAAIFTDLEEARRRIGHYIDYYNFRRPHQGIDGLTPAERFFSAAPKVLDMLRRRVAENSLELARRGTPKKPFYLTGQVGGRSFSVHAEGERVFLQREEGKREEIELTAQEKDGSPQEAEPPSQSEDGVAPGEVSGDGNAVDDETSEEGGLS